MFSPRKSLPSISSESNNQVLNIDWIVEMPETEATATVGTDVRFEWSSYHNVYMFPSKTDFENCNFDKATEVASNDQNPFTFKASTPGTFYFGCEVGNGWHCRTPQKLALTVTGNSYVCDAVPCAHFSIHVHARSEPFPPWLVCLV